MIGLGHSALMALGRRLSNAGLNFGEVRYQMEEAIRVGATRAAAKPTHFDALIDDVNELLAESKRE